MTEKEGRRHNSTLASVFLKKKTERQAANRYKQA